MPGSVSQAELPIANIVGSGVMGGLSKPWYEPSTYVDQLDDGDLRCYLSSWCEDRCSLKLSDQDLDGYYNTISPRSIFLKTSPFKASIIDMGAGNGALSIYGRTFLDKISIYTASHLNQSSVLDFIGALQYLILRQIRHRLRG